MNSEFIDAAYLAWIAGAKLTAGETKKLVTSYPTGRDIYSAVMKGDSLASQIIPPAALTRMRLTGTREYLQRMQELITRHNIRTMTIHNGDFPEILKEIPDPVSILFYQGNPGCLQGRIIGMVGSRRASYNGLKAAGTISCELSRHGVSVISGFAYGIDSACHQGCLNGGSATIAVMGCGLDQNYPSDNTELKVKILQAGGIFLSEYAPGEKPLSGNFPYRNRIISALGDALILVEARLRSGSLRTVDHALRQGKDIFVYPGDPASSNFEGNHQLLRDGARYFTTAHDVLEDMNWLDNTTNEVQNSECNTSGGTESPAQEKILKLLARGEMSFEQISAVSSLTPAELMSLLTILQIRGKVDSLPGKKYSLKTSS